MKISALEIIELARTRQVADGHGADLGVTLYFVATLASIALRMVSAAFFYKALHEWNADVRHPPRPEEIKGVT